MLHRVPYDPEYTNFNAKCPIARIRKCIRTVGPIQVLIYSHKIDPILDQELFDVTSRNNESVVDFLFKTAGGSPV